MNVEQTVANVLKIEKSLDELVFWARSKEASVRQLEEEKRALRDERYPEGKKWREDQIKYLTERIAELDQRIKDIKERVIKGACGEAI